MDTDKKNIFSQLIVVALAIGLIIFASNSIINFNPQKLLILIGIIFAPICFIYWRETLLIIPLWILVEGWIRKSFFDSITIFFIKDVALSLVYLRLAIEYLKLKKSLIFKSPVNAPIIILFLWYLLELFNPNLPSVLMGLVGIKVIFYYFPYFYLTRYLFKDVGSLFKYIKVVLILSILVSALGYYQFHKGEDSTQDNLTYFVNKEGENIIRPSSSFYYNSNYGQYVYFMMLIIISVVNIKYFNKSKILLILIFIANLVGLLVSGQRSAWAALAAQISFIFILNPFLPRRYSIIPKLAFLGFLSAVVITTLLPKSYESFSSRVEMTMENPESSGYKFTYAMEEISIRSIFATHPFIGHGPGTNTPAARHLDKITSTLDEQKGGTEGGYVQMWWEIGLIGMIFFVWLLLALLKHMFSIRRSLRDPDLKQLSIVGILFCTGYMIANITAGMLNTASTSILFWLILGLSPTLKELDSKNEKNSTGTP